VTSPSKVLVPGCADVKFVFPDQRFGRPDPAVTNKSILRQFDMRLKPELGVAVGVMHLHMEARLFAGKEKNPKRSSRKMVGLKRDA